MSEIYKSYYAIIPANVRYDKELKDKAKLLYGEITALCNEKGYCWATNNYFANLYGVTKETISRLISNLANKDYVRVEIIYEGKQIIERRIYITPEVIAQKSIPIDEKINTPLLIIRSIPLMTKLSIPLLTKTSRIIIQILIIHYLIIYLSIKTKLIHKTNCLLQTMMRLID